MKTIIRRADKEVLLELNILYDPIGKVIVGKYSAGDYFVTDNVTKDEIVRTITFKIPDIGY